MSVNHQERYVVLDVETTGLWPWRGDRVIEVGAVAIEGGGMIAEFNTLVQAPREIPFRASQIHGITDEMLIGQPTPEEVFPAFEAFLQDSIIIAHNARFDIGFLRRENELLGARFHPRYICTLEMSRHRFPHLRNHKLETVYRHLMEGKLGGELSPSPATCFDPPLILSSEPAEESKDGLPKQAPLPGVENKFHPHMQTHRALDDARMVARIWLAMEE